MSKIAFIYPGQGAQAVGMGQDFYENSPLSKAVFDQASEAVSLDLKKLCFEENDLLNKTEYTQVAMVTACIAMTRAVEAMGLHADMTQDYPTAVQSPDAALLLLFPVHTEFPA